MSEKIIYTLKLRTSMLSWLRTPVAIEWLADCWFNTQSQLICIIIALHHPEPACNDDTCQPGHALQDFHYWKRRTLGLVDVHDNNNLESLMSSDVNNDRLLTTDKVVLFNAVDCSWYNNADGTDLQRPMRMTLGIGTLAAMAIVGPDNRIDCVLNHSSLSPKWEAEDFTAFWMSKYNKHFCVPEARNDKKGSASNRNEYFDQR